MNRINKRQSVFLIVLFFAVAGLICVTILANKKSTSNINIAVPVEIYEKEGVSSETRKAHTTFRDKCYWPDLEEDWLVYDSWSVFREERDLPYVDQETFEIIRAAYAEIDFRGEFLPGDLAIYDEYKGIFLKLLQNEITFLDEETGQEIYLADFYDLTGDHDYNAEKYEYYFFDVDEDGTPEMGVHNPDYLITDFFYKYDSDTGRCILWYIMDGSWDIWFGSRKYANNWGGKYLTFIQFEQNKEVECETFCFSMWFNEEESLHMAMLPKYAEEEKETVVTDEMKAQGVFERSSGQWYFRVTEEQYDELTKSYWEALVLAREKSKEIIYTYEELFGSLSS